jgi:hypothetical protein
LHSRTIEVSVALKHSRIPEIIETEILCVCITGCSIGNTIVELNSVDPVRQAVYHLDEAGTIIRLCGILASLEAQSVPWRKINCREHATFTGLTLCAS